MKLLLSSRPYGSMILGEGIGDFLDMAGRVPFLSGLELWSSDFHVLEEAHLFACRRLAADAGLALSLFSLATDFGDQDIEKREEEMETAGRWAELAYKLGAQVFRIQSGEHHGRERDFVELVRCLQVMQILLEETGVCLAIENDAVEEGLIQSAAELENLVDSLEGEPPAMAVDLLAMMGMDPYGLAVRFASKAHVLRLKLAEDLDLVRMGKLLRQASYHRYLIVEPIEAAVPETLAPKLEQLMTGV